MAILNVGFILSCIFVASVALVGVFTMFANAENIERPFVVGGLTLSTTLLSIVWLDHDYRVNFPYGNWVLLAVCLVAASGFGLGRLVDFLMGARPESVVVEDGALGGDLAD